MRTRFFELLDKEMEQNQKVVLLFGDMGRGIFEQFKEKFSDRVLNIGIAEQNLIGMAAGLACMGYTPYCYTISNFLVERCYEQIRNDIYIPGHKVILVGTSTGFDSGSEGATHFSLEDIALIRTMPEFGIYAPSTVDSVDSCYEKIKASSTASYIRLGKGKIECQHTKSCNFYAIESDVKEILLVTYGNTLTYCLKAAQEKKGISVIAINELNPVDADFINCEFQKYQKVIVVEEQIKGSGLFSILAQMMLEKKIKYRDIESNLIDNYPINIGNKDYFAMKYGFSAEQLLSYCK